MEKGKGEVENMDPLTINLIVSLSWPIVTIISFWFLYKLLIKLQSDRLAYKKLKECLKLMHTYCPTSTTPPSNTLASPSATTNNQWRSEWSRHYDQIHWLSNTIFIGMIGALLVYSYQDFKLFPALLGLWLSLFTLYYSSSFRNMRDILHKDMLTGDEKNFLLDSNKNRILHQWPVYLITHCITIFGWIYIFWSHNKILAIISGILSMVVVILICKKGKQYPFK